MSDAGYTISELAEEACVTTRTIRYYTAEGLLPPPDTRGKYARYSSDHLLRLQVIAKLKEEFLPLGEIRTRLAQVGVQELRALLAEPSAAPVSSALDYLDQVIGPRPATARLREHAQPIEPATAVPSPPAALPPAAPQHPGPLAKLFRRQAPEPKQPPVAEAEEQWRRIILVPGVELHTREPQSPTQAARITKLIAHARAILTGKEGHEL
ncbi:MAG: hypothetical protein Fur005_22710 [Roseiflexaceae bacterium]